MPQRGDLVLFKPDYSAFDGTALGHRLDERGVTRVVLTGAVTEMGVAQTGLAARASGGDGAHRKIVLTGAPVENSDGGSGSLVPSTKRITPVSA
jgi:nicotinamidase-related amidase